MKIIIADSSAVVRAILEQKLDGTPDVEIIDSVSNSKKLINSVAQHRPDVIISGLDENSVEEKDDLSTLLTDMRVPVLLLSEKEILPDCDGLLEIMEKPKLSDYEKPFIDSLVENLKRLASSRPNAGSRYASGSPFKVLCIGASTGGPSAVSAVLQGLGANFPLPILYAQHIDVGCDETMASWFSNVCKNVRVKLAENGEEAKAGTVYMAPADKHLMIDFVAPDGTAVLCLSDEEPERFLRPSVNKLFRSAAKLYRQNCLAVLLTGMGADGAEGCKMICDNGGWTIAEDKSTCVVFGMPAAAIEMGGAKEVLPRGQISKRILELVKNDAK